MKFIIQSSIAQEQREILGVEQMCVKGNEEKRTQDDQNFVLFPYERPIDPATFQYLKRLPEHCLIMILVRIVIHAP